MNQSTLSSETISDTSQAPNTVAKVAGYCALFTFLAGLVLPALGFLSAMVGLVLGVRGLRIALSHPARNGLGLSVFAIVIGVFVFLVNVLFMLAISYNW